MSVVTIRPRAKLSFCPPLHECHPGALAQKAVRHEDHQPLVTPDSLPARGKGSGLPNVMGSSNTRVVAQP